MLAKPKITPKELFIVTAKAEFNEFVDGLILFVVLESLVTGEKIKLTVENFNRDFEIILE